MVFLVAWSIAWSIVNCPILAGLAVSVFDCRLIRKSLMVVAQ